MPGGVAGDAEASPPRPYADHGVNVRSSCARNFILDSAPRRAYVRRVPLTEGVSGDEPESERDAASCARGS
jgi:hypothetical protein